MPTFSSVPLSSYVDTSSFARCARTPNVLPRRSTSVATRRRALDNSISTQKSLGRSVHFKTANDSSLGNNTNKSNGCLKPGKKPIVESRTRDTLDYSGISNMMRNISFQSRKRWRLKNPENDPDKKYFNKNTSPDDSHDVSRRSSSQSLQIFRKVPKPFIAKYRYPKEFHSGDNQKKAAIEERIPRCLKHDEAYCQLPMRQSCHYNPYRSVTLLKFHSVKSGSLPHPPVSNAKPRRSMSAPPTMSVNTTMEVQNTGKSSATVQANNGVYYSVHREKKAEEHFSMRGSPVQSLSPEAESIEVEVMSTRRSELNEGELAERLHQDPQHENALLDGYTNPSIVISDYGTDKEVEEWPTDETKDASTISDGGAESLEIEDETVSNWRNVDPVDSEDEVDDIEEFLRESQYEATKESESETGLRRMGLI